MHYKSSIYQADWDNSPVRKPPLRKKYLPLLFILIETIRMSEIIILYCKDIIVELYLNYHKYF